jgi:PAS domain S-box-containing protein
MKLLGIEGDEAISIKRLLAALHPGDRERWKEAVAQVLDAEGSAECHLEFRAAGPAERWLAASGRAFFEGMRAVRVAGTLRDITEQRRAEEELVLKRERVALAGICREAIDEASLAYPGHPIEFESWDDAPGEWDHDRLLQVAGNLLSNALSHGAAGEPVIVSVVDCSAQALLAVANRGQPIPDPVREHLFDPARRASEGYFKGERS